MSLVGLLKKSLAAFSATLCFSNVTFCQETEGEAAKRAVSSSAIIHKEPYDITPYEGKPWQELEVIAMPHTNHEIYISGPVTVNVLPLTCFVDENWKAMCNIYQASIRQYKEATRNLDEKFSGKCAGIRLFSIIPPSHFFFLWKQAAWIHPDYAEALAYALKHGFQDKIAANPEWSAYWTAREESLRNSKGWYIPRDRVVSAIPQGADIFLKLDILLAIKEQFKC